MNENQPLNLNMNVSELLSQWPEVIPVFLRYRMACVGCSMNSFETLGDAARIYGMAPETFLDELHRAISPSD